MDHAKSYEATKVEDYKQIKITSPAFKQNEMIPSKYTCDGMNVNPPLLLEHIPEEAQSLAIIVEDPDAPAGTWIHWILWNIPVTHHIEEGHQKGIQGINSFKHYNYGGPCPPAGVHHYIFKIYALDSVLNLTAGSGKNELEKAMSEHIVGLGVLIGKYGRNKK